MIKNKAIDWDNLGFNVIETRSMYVATFDSNCKWESQGLKPYGNISLSPASAVLNYGQGVFEGTKSFMSSKGQAVFFRLKDNANRFASSSKRLCIPEISTDFFIDAVNEVVKDNLDYIPDNDKGSLYIRPLVLGTGPMLGVKPAKSYTFLIFVTPVGSYFNSGLKYLDAIITKEYHRSATKSIGSAKAIGNYSGTLLPYKEIVENGFDEIIFLNSSNEDILDEARSANIFIIKDNILKTPSLRGSILPGITRDSVLKIADSILGLDIEEGDVTIHELLNADEVFFTGTAVVVAPVGSVSLDSKKYNYSIDFDGSLTKQIRDSLLDIQNEKVGDRFGWITKVKL